jgi:hypothetical protein
MTKRGTVYKNFDNLSILTWYELKNAVLANSEKRNNLPYTRLSKVI